MRAILALSCGSGPISLKNAFQVHAVDAKGGFIARKLTPGRLAAFFSGRRAVRRRWRRAPRQTAQSEATEQDEIPRGGES